MAKKSRRNRKRHEREHDNDLTEQSLVKQMQAVVSVETATGPIPEPPTSVPEPRSEWLAQLRANTVNAQVQAAHTIAELEAWRDEIDSTLAFLRARK